MKIIGQTLNGYIIEATNTEVRAILDATGVKSKGNKVEPVVGDRLPAFDYAGVIVQCKAFKTSYDYTEIKRKMTDLSDTFFKITSAVDSLDFKEDV
jgi:hypothetical protein